MDIQKNNLRIARWMGAREIDPETYEHGDNTIQIQYLHIDSAPPSHRHHNVHQHDADALHYHDDMAWQIPVIDRIELLGYDFSIISENGYYHARIASATNTLPNGYYKTRCEAIWHGILTFLDYFDCDKPNDNLTQILEEFEKHKGQLVIIGYNHIVRLIAIGDDGDDWYYVTYNGREQLRWSTCVGPLIPLKGYLREDDYDTLLSIAKGNHWDLQLESSNSPDLTACRDQLLSVSANHVLITAPCWKLN
jgi:hypothetical protein